jgi:hypothetical protein
MSWSLMPWSCLGLAAQSLGLGLGLETQSLGLGLGLEAQSLGLGLGLAFAVLRPSLCYKQKDFGFIYLLIKWMLTDKRKRDLVQDVNRTNSLFWFVRC